jgi:UDP-glucose:(heptosyl)LPS alpha-1,3-glucosyltransferase
MNIALVIFRGEEHRGGAERYTADIAGDLARRGHRVDLISTRFGKDISGVNFVPISAKSPTRAGRYLQFLDHLDRHFSGKKYDLIHSMLPIRRCDIYHPHSGMAAAALETHLAAENAAARALGGLANRLNRKRRLYAEVETALIHGPDRPLVLCLSDYVKKMVLQYYPGISNQLVKLFNGTDLNTFDPAGHAGARMTIRRKFEIAPDAPVALMIAQHFERKGIAELISATAKIVGQWPIRVLVVGKDDPARSRQLAQKLGVEKNIIFAGQTTCSADFYAAADFFVLPTRHDSCSLVVLEALAMGVPVISTAFNGACEIMTEAKHGHILPDPADVDALALAMTDLLNPQIRREMSGACVALRPALSFETHMDQLEEIYRRRLGR